MPLNSAQYPQSVELCIRKDEMSDECVSMKLGVSGNLVSSFHLFLIYLLKHSHSTFSCKVNI